MAKVHSYIKFICRKDISSIEVTNLRFFIVLVNERVGPFILCVGWVFYLCLKLL